MSLFIKADLDEREQDLARRLGLFDALIKTGDFGHFGKHRISRNHRLAHRGQVAKVKGRWNAAAVATSGANPLDTIIRTFAMFQAQILLFVRQVFGRRATLRAAMRGITIWSDDVRSLRAAELAILTSLAAVSKALDYMNDAGWESRVDAADMTAELIGLDFAGAGSDIDDERGGVTPVKALLIIALIVVAAIAALNGLGRQLSNTFEQLPQESSAQTT